MPKRQLSSAASCCSRWLKCTAFREARSSFPLTKERACTSCRKCSPSLSGRSSVAVNVLRSEHNKILQFIIEICDFGVVSLPVPDKRLTIVLFHTNECSSDHAARASPGQSQHSEHCRPGRLSSAPAEGRAYPLCVGVLFHERQLKPTISMELDSSELLETLRRRRCWHRFYPTSTLRVT